MPGSSRSFHLLVCLSSHGYGHFAMTAPILNAFIKQKNIRLTLRSTLPRTLLASRIDCDFEYIAQATDFGMQMKSSLDIDLQRSAEMYRDFHANYAAKVELEKQSLTEIKPDLILANIPYLTIDAASQCGIPCIAYCSLNWLEIFEHYFLAAMPEAKQISQQIMDAYNKADVFLRPAPSMSMQQLNNTKTIGPVAVKNQQKIDLTKVIGCGQNKKLVLISPGGVPTEIPVYNWPKVDHIIWVCSWPIKTHREDIICTDDIELEFNIVLANCDAVICKPGYGIVTEAVCNQIPALYVKRDDWPEEPYLIDWWRKKGVVEEIPREALTDGNVLQPLQALWQREFSEVVEPDGIKDACGVLNSFMVI